MSSQQNSTNPASAPSLSFDGISKHFSVPLSDAAANLGVCVTVLKKICRDNGLDRWPYRKFLAGKSIEEIRKDAARERNKELAALSKVGSQSGLQPQNSEISKLQGVTSPHNLPQQGSKSIVAGRPWQNVSATKGMTTLDDLRYGFPSDGLSTATNKWWGSSSPDEAIHEVGAETETDEENKQQSEEKVDDGADSMVVDGEKHEDIKMKRNVASQGSSSLVAIRKRTVGEAREALRLGVYQGYGLKKLGKREKTLLFQVFKSSLPEEWLQSSS